MRRSQYEIVVGRQQGKLMANAELRQNGIDRAKLQTGATTAISEFRRIDVILAVGRQKWQDCESVDDVFARPRAGKSLQQFLQDQPGGQDSIATFEGIAQRRYLRGRRDLVASKGKRPHAGIDEQAHRRVRSTL